MSGISSIKAGFDLIKSLREILKKPDVDHHEVSNRLMEIQELFLEAQSALNDAEDENRQLKRQLEEQDKIRKTEADLEMTQDGRFFVLKSQREKNEFIPYCPVCWGATQKLVPLPQVGWQGLLKCPIDNSEYRTAAYEQKLRSATIRI